MRLVYLGYLGVNNIGDEVCYEAFLQAIKKWSNGAHTVFPFPFMSKKTLKDYYKIKPFDGVILGGGSLLQGNVFIDLALEAIDMKLPLYCYGTGIDYFSEETVASFQKNTFAFNGSTFHNKPLDRQKIKKIVEYATFTGLRGPLTLEYIRTLQAASLRYAVIGDSGMVFTPPKTNYIESKYLQSNTKKKWIAVNWGTTKNVLFGYNEAQVKEQLVKSCEYLQKLGYLLVIFPMWDKDQPECKTLHQRLTKSGEAVLIPEVCTASQIYHFLARCEFSINLKLHANVLSASSGTPFIQLAYRSKGVDFAASIQQLEYTILTSTTSLLSFVKEKEPIIRSSANLASLKMEKEKIIQQHQQFIAAIS